MNKFLSLSKDVRFDEIRKVLEFYGYKMTIPRGGSSHHIFRKEGKEPIVIPKHDIIKKVYVERIKKVIEEELHNEDN